MASGKTEGLAFQSVQLTMSYTSGVAAKSTRNLTKSNTSIQYSGDAAASPWSENEYQDDYYMVMTRFNSGNSLLALSLVDPNTSNNTIMSVKNIFSSTTSSPSTAVAHIHGILIPKSMVEEG